MVRLLSGFGSYLQLWPFLLNPVALGQKGASAKSQKVTGYYFFLTMNYYRIFKPQASIPCSNIYM